MDCGRLHTLGRTYGDDDCVECVIADIMMERDEARAEVERLRECLRMTKFAVEILAEVEESEVTKVVASCCSENAYPKLKQLEDGRNCELAALIAKVEGEG